MAFVSGAAENDEPEFRNGCPVRMAGWLHIKTGKFLRKQHRYAKLEGEVLSFHLSQHNLAEEEFDVVGTHIDYSDRESKRSLKLFNGRRVYTITCASPEEMQSWAQCLLFASQRCFDRYYQLGALIAEGTYSRVYYAYPALEHPDQNLDEEKVFAVKIIKKPRKDVQFLEWVRRERHVNTILNHRNIVQAVDMFSTVEKDHIVFEFMRGGTLADLLAKHKVLPESYARVVMVQLLTALCHIHAKNIVHRDVRPENIFCSATKFPMSIALGDFGYSTFVSEKRVNHDVLTTMIGVPPYICVDICRRLKYGPLVDMWSAGVVLYEMLSGDTPFKGRSDKEVLERIKKGVVKFDNPIWKRISPDAKRFILQLLQADPHKRISALAALQHEWLYQCTGLSRPTSLSASNPTSPSTGDAALAKHSSPGNTSMDNRRPNGIPNSLSNMSRIPSSSSSQSPAESTHDKSESSERQTSLLGVQPSFRSMQHASSTSSLSGQPKIQVAPSVRMIAEIGLQRASSDNPAKMKRLLSSKVVQKQLSMTLPWRRKLIVVGRAFVAVFRLQSLVKGHSATRQLSLMGKGDVDEVNSLIAKRKKAMEKSEDDSKSRNTDRNTGHPLQASHHGQRRGHVRQRSRDVASHIMGRLSIDRKQQEVMTGQR